MFKNVIPGLVSIETKLGHINGLYFIDNFNFYPSIKNKNKFHYKIAIKNNIIIPHIYDFKNGHYYKKDNIWYYKRKIGFFTLKFSYDLKNRIFFFNRIYSFIPFEIGHIFPIGRHLADLINFELFLNSYIFIRGCAVNYKNITTAFIGPSRNGKTSLVELIVKKGGKYISEEFIILDKKSNNIFPTSCLTTHGRLINSSLNNKLNKKNIIKEKVYLDKLVLFFNNTNIKYVHTKKDVFDFIMLRSIFFLKSDFVKSYIFVENYTQKLFDIINEIKSISIKYKFIKINDYQFDDLFK